MELVQKIIQQLKFVFGFTDLGINFLKYKYFERNNIKRNEEDINGKCVVVTGGSSGIGRSSAKEFAQRGATVVIGDVDLVNGQFAVEEIQRETGNMNVTILKLDLSDMDSVEEFANKVSTNHPKIKILLNNAGIGGSKNENIKTKDGFNIHVAVNFMGHFLLTHLLMDNLKAEVNPRIVMTSSTMLYLSKLNIDDLNMDKSGFGFQNGYPYCNTKLMLALFTKELRKQNGINSYAVCPGLVDTDINKNLPKLLGTVFRITMPKLSSSVDEAASEFMMYCALEMSIQNQTGKMYRYRKEFYRANKLLNKDLARNLCEKSAELVRLNERLEKKNRVTK